MLVLYIILGTLTSISVLYGIAWERLRRGRWNSLHWASLVLVALAWLLEHTSILGTVCLIAAILTEAAVWYARRQREAGDLLLAGMDDEAGLDDLSRELAAADDAEFAEPVDEASPEALAAVQGDAVSKPALVAEPAVPMVEPRGDDVLDTQPIGLFLRTLVLLKNEYRVAPPVLLASVRRAGQRDAVLATSQPVDATAALEAGELRIALRTSRAPADPARLEAAVGQAERHEEAFAIAEGHACYLEITTLFHFDTPRDAMVRCQHRLHAALSEFAPVVGVLWPTAGRLIPARQLSSLQRLANANEGSMLKTCTSLRTFPLDGAHAGFVLSDTLGMFVFGLPDLQVITEGAPPLPVRRWLAETAERFFLHGCDLADQSEISFGEDDVWRVKLRRSAFAPDREVLQIAPRREAPGAWGGSWEVNSTAAASTPDAAPEIGGGWGAAEG